MKYYSIEHTPLKWHTFYRYVSMPLGVITGIIAILNYIAAMDNLFYLVDIFFCLVQTVCCAVAFVGFFKWKSSAWYAVVINLANTVIYAIVSLIVAVVFAGDVAYSFGSLLGTTLTSVLIFIYYNKRKPLFFNMAAPAEPEKDVIYGLPNRVCGNCGAALTDSGSFCSNCGAPLR